MLAAGGIVTGRQVAASIALGAAGAWTGSVWLTTEEAETAPVHGAEDARGVVSRHGSVEGSHRKAFTATEVGVDRCVDGRGERTRRAADAVAVRRLRERVAPARHPGRERQQGSAGVGHLLGGPRSGFDEQGQAGPRGGAGNDRGLPGCGGARRGVSWRTEMPKTTDSTAIDPRTPIMVGVGQAAERVEDLDYQGRSPIDLAVAAARSAVADTGADTQTVIAAIDTIACTRQFENSTPGAPAPLGKSTKFPVSVGNQARSGSQASGAGSRRRPITAASGHRVRPRDPRRCGRCRTADRSRGDVDDPPPRQVGR